MAQSALSYVRKRDHEQFGTSRLVERLRRAGWRDIGSGATAMVFQSPQKDRILKVVRPYKYKDEGGEAVPDGGMTATLAAALANPSNPHLPRFFGYERLENGTLLVEMEPLERINPQSYRDWNKRWGFGRSFYAASSATARSRSREPMQQAVSALVKAAQQTGRDFNWDSHDWNIMVRPSTGEVVLNDLLYDKGPSR